jgi:hypothetical protein
MKLENIDNNFYIVSDKLFNNIKFIEFKRAQEGTMREDNEDKEEYFTKEITEITFSKLRNKILIENLDTDTIIITQLNKEILELPIVIQNDIKVEADIELTNKLESLQNMLLPVSLSGGDPQESFELFEKMGSGLSRLLSNPTLTHQQIQQTPLQQDNIVFSIKKK